MGDIIFVGKDQKKKTTDFKIAFRANHPQVILSNNPVNLREYEGASGNLIRKINTADQDLVTEAWIAYAKVLRKQGKKIIAYSNDDGATPNESYARVYLVNSVIIYDKATNKLYKGTNADILPGDKMYIATQWTQVKTALIIRENEGGIH